MSCPRCSAHVCLEPVRRDEFVAAVLAHDATPFLSVVPVGVVSARWYGAETGRLRLGARRLARLGRDQAAAVGGGARRPRRLAASRAQRCPLRDELGAGEACVRVELEPPRGVVLAQHKT